MQDTRNKGDGWRLPARALEKAVIDGLCGVLRDQPRLIEEIGATSPNATQIRHALASAEELADRLSTASPDEQHRLLHQLIRRIDLAPEDLRLRVDRPVLIDALDAGQGRSKDHEAGATIDLDVPFSLRRRGVEAKLILGARDKTGHASALDPMLVQMIVMAHHSHQILISGEAASINDLAEITGQHPSDVTRLIHLAYLAPDITEAILDGRQPTELTAKRLQRLCPVPLDWSEQRQRLGMTAHVAP